MLYVVGTPIGNLQDLSYRQASLLSNADIIVAEDTRRAGVLLQHIPDYFPFEVNTKRIFIAYYKEREMLELPRIMNYLQEDKQVCIISDSGMPLISDPGYLLIKTVINEGLPMTVVPGPTAFATALVHSGFNPAQAMFVGFLPKKTTDLKKQINLLRTVKQTFPDVIFSAYESPERINKTLAIIGELFPTEICVVARELTKQYEEIIRGKASDIQSLSYRGEITILWQ